MDVNQHAYFLFREAEEFANRSTRMTWDEQRKALTLIQNQQLKLPQTSSADALLAWGNASPLVVDQFNQQARIAVAGNFLEYNSGRGFLPLVDGDLNPVDAPSGNFTDIAIGGDGRLAATYSNGTDTHGVLVFHLGKRWQAAAPLPELPIRVMVDHENKVWCLSQERLMCCKGEPLPHTYQPQPDRFEPRVLNPHPLQIVWQGALNVGDEPLGLSCNQQRLAILVHDGAGGQTLVTRSLVLAVSPWLRYPVDEECPFAIDVSFLSENRVALLVPKEISDVDFEKRDCAVVTLEKVEDDFEGYARLVYERFPMLSQAQARFVSSADKQLRYQAQVDAESEQSAAGYNIYPRRLQALRRPKYISAAFATISNPLDSGTPDTVWHRVYLHGCIPSGCKVIIYAKAYNNPDDRTSTPFIRQPDWIWNNQVSERAFGKGVTESIPDKSGLFELLLQRDSGPVRRLAGRYLSIRIRLESNGTAAPSVSALKIYYPRFSYQEAFLPEHFRQEMPVDTSLNDLPANGADVRERLLAVFEGVLTPIERKIASSEIFLSPQNTPHEHLSWLAELFGQTVPIHWPESRRRRWLTATGALQKCRGTLAGIYLALDILTDGGVEKGQVVVVENFRLRRTMATILGLNMDDRNHPLTLGTGMSGNSLVGDSLILSDENSKAFLSLFAAELSTDAEAEEVEAFFDKYANRISVLLHGPAKKLKRTVETILAEQVPAHLQWQVIETDHPFVLGLSPLLGVDTYLDSHPEFRPVVLNDTYLGREGLLTNPVALSPQDINSDLND